MPLVYKITNEVNGKVYIGYTSRTLHERWLEHTSPSRYGRNTALYNAFQKYGTEAFKIEEVFNSDSIEEVLAKERELILEYNSYNTGGYNSTLGGDKAPHTPEVCAKISASKMGHGVSEEAREKIKISLKKYFSNMSHEERREKTAYRRRKWLVTFNDKTFEVSDLRKFANAHDLNYGSLVTNKGFKTKNISIIRIEN